MSDFFNKKQGTDARGSSNKASCVFDWTPGEAVSGSAGNEAKREDRPSVVFESDIISDGRS